MNEQTGYWLTRFLLLRLLGVVYCVAFLVAAEQIVPLIGHRGLLPVDAFLRAVEDNAGSRLGGFAAAPSVFWIGASDAALVATAWIGCALSLIVVAGFANAIVMAVLWALYMSIVHVGQTWYGFGWEIQLLETGFLAIFLCPLLDPRPFPRLAPPVVVIWLYRWLIFRIMLGAGLIKMRGDSCWRDLTCLYYHYETQPIPNPLSRWLHFAPRWTQQAGTLFNHVTELGAPWLAFGPRIVRILAGVLMLSFQIVLMLSGNLSFLNYLTLVPVLACFDDRLLGRVLPSRLVARAERAAEAAEPSRAQQAVSYALAGVVFFLSIDPIANLLSQRQVMNTSFGSLDLVNSYGAFGAVGRERREIVFEGTRDEQITSETRWLAYEFPCKPGDPERRPCFASPYHYRLDWLLWFAAMAGPEDYPWTLHVVWKLLEGDPEMLRLVAVNPFPDAPPRYVRVQLYRYWFAPPGDASPAWWKRKLLGPWLPPLSADDPRFRRILRRFGWEPLANPRGP